MPALIHKGLQGRPNGPVFLGRDLRDAKEESFVRMVCDGVQLRVAFDRAGFLKGSTDAATLLWDKPHIQERAALILEARATQGLVTLPQVTDMLQRVFYGAIQAEDYGPAHNAAFSLARLYGHVTDKASIEVSRKPSRDPDAPSEQALAVWAAGLPALPGLEASGLEASGLGALGPALDERGSNPPLPRAPATPDIHASEPRAIIPSYFNGLPYVGPLGLEARSAGPGPSGPELSNEIKGLAWTGVRGRSENGAPTRAVTGTPTSGAHSGSLAESQQGSTPPTPHYSEKGPLLDMRVPVPENGGIKRYPPAEDLF